MSITVKYDDTYALLPVWRVDRAHGMDEGFRYAQSAVDRVFQLCADYQRCYIYMPKPGVLEITDERHDCMQEVFAGQRNDMIDTLRSHMHMMQGGANG